MPPSKIETVDLWTSPHNIWLEMQDKSLPVLSLSRDSNPSVRATDHANIPAIAVRKSIHGILGVVKLPLTTFLVTVSQKRKVGDVEGHAIYRVESTDFIPISSTPPSSSTEVDAQRQCQALLRDAINTPYFYFSYTGDLTNTRQRQALASQEAGDSKWKKADKRFLWNYHMAGEFLQLATSSTLKTDMSHFLIQMIHGAVFTHRCSVNGVYSTYSYLTFSPALNFCACSNPLSGASSRGARVFRRAPDFLRGAPTETATLPTFVKPSKWLNMRAKSLRSCKRADQCLSTGLNCPASSTCPRPKSWARTPRTGRP